MTYYLLHSGQMSAERLAAEVPRLVATEELRYVGPEDVVIRFGNTEDPDRGRWTINRRESLLVADSRRALLKTLRRAGVHCPRFTNRDEEAETRNQLIRHYRVPVFNLRALTCFRTEGRMVWLSKRINQIQDHFSEVGLEADEETRKVSLLAVRAMHAVGLEFGLVSIGIGQKGRPIVLDISATPVCKGRLLRLFATAIEDFIAVDEQISQGVEEKILLGTDLEFMLRSRQGKLIPASRYFPMRGKVGCDDRTLAGNRALRPLAEIRPQPAETPEVLCKNIELALREAQKFAPAAHPEWVAGSAPFEHFPIGGHLHFSGVPYTARIVNLLDAYVGMPLMLIEDPMTATRRRPKYGFLGDIRHKSYGGFEYRTPASFLVDPNIALGALALAYVIAHHHAELPYIELHDASRLRAFYRNDRDFLLPIAKEVYANIKQTSSYLPYREAIDLIFAMIQSDEVWDESVDIRKAWQLPIPIKASGKKKIQSSVQARGGVRA
ncbi:putative amidoligase domain-containing protein [Sulfoacidibacillus thermotolerans]|uniref:Phage phiEco32-like COOH-NH2 ligase-type 2 n=1 Tax=Sulfoacidibacillus thermotolerans TaxID=1765684 RepID=A0A2U3DAG9_SULT2|nr:hypothetical protein [Sulfoacidibacillus thermotolerans]PWI58252.1 hypothetical protein BM613_04820 [Sulfoacidibacillus thermotolerans]